MQSKIGLILYSENSFPCNSILKFMIDNNLSNFFKLICLDNNESLKSSLKSTCIKVVPTLIINGNTKIYEGEDDVLNYLKYFNRTTNNFKLNSPNSFPVTASSSWKIIESEDLHILPKN